MINAESLGDPRFKAAYGLRYAYVAGGMYKGIASAEMVIALGRAGLMGYLGAGGMRADQLVEAIASVKSALANGEPWGVNLVCSRPEHELATARVFLAQGARNVEMAGFLRVTPALVLLRLKGARRRANGNAAPHRRLLAKISKVEVASAFMQPAPANLVAQLRMSGDLSPEECECAQLLPMADDICVESDSGGHTDQGVAFTLLPAILSLRDESHSARLSLRDMHIGAAGGIGTPEAAAAAFTLGADFILTGSINQCTVEAGTSDVVKSMLQGIDIRDTTYAPAGDMFEMGSRVQVLKRGSFFAARANRLYELYRGYGSLEELGPAIRSEIEGFFGRSIDSVWEESRAYHASSDSVRLQQIERNGRQKMASVFKWYFIHTSRLAREGAPENRRSFQVHCGPALGAFNRSVRGTALEPWQNRHVAAIGIRLMSLAAEVLGHRYQRLMLGVNERSHA